MNEAHEARRICLTEDPGAAAEMFSRRALDPRHLERLLRATAEAGEAARSETVELPDTWGRSATTTLYVPPSTGDRPKGVIVGLHGVGGSGAQLEPYLRPLADACGAVLLCPTARLPVSRTSNFDMAGLFGGRFHEARWTTDPGDFPVRALHWAREHLAIDVDRCALVGTSMGGIATWGIASRRWDNFAMAASINGAPSIWEMFGPDTTMRELLPNLLNLPFIVVHGSRDQQIPAALDQEAVRRLEGLGHRALSLVEVSAGEHGLSTMQLTPGNEQFDAVVRCFRSSRRTPWPGRIRHYAREGTHGRAHWVAMHDITHGRTAAVDARIMDRSRLDVRVHGCSRLQLHLSDRLVDPGRLLVTVNGRARVIDFRPSMHDAVATYAEAGADPGRMAHMVADLEVPESHELKGESC